MTERKKLGCNGNYRRAKHYFKAVRFSEPGQRGAADLIEGLADLGAPCSTIAAYLDIHAETVRDWHDHDAELPVLVWDMLLDLGVILIEEGELRNERREALATCTCPACNRRRKGKPQSTLRDVFKEIAGISSKSLKPQENRANS